MTIKYVFFDIADTLLFIPELFGQISEVLQKYGIYATDEQLSVAHKTVKELLVAPSTTGKEFYTTFNSRFLEVLGILPEPSLVSDIYIACRGMVWRAFPDASVLLEIKQAKGVISNWDRTLREKLNELFPPIFDPVVVSQEIGVAKPDVAIYLEAVRLSGVQPEQILFVGDSIHLDIVPALSVGMKPILLDRTGYYNLYNGLKISSLNELPSIIDSIEG